MDCGIYSITNIITGEKYIGQTVRLYRRELEHFAALKRCNHDNKHLQHSFNKYAEEHFVYEILDICIESELTIKEQSWMDHFEILSVKLFNMLPADSGAKRLPRYEFVCPICKKISMFTLNQLAVRKTCSRKCADAKNSIIRLGKGWPRKYFSKNEKMVANRATQARLAARMRARGLNIKGKPMRRLKIYNRIDREGRIESKYRREWLAVGFDIGRIYAAAHTKREYLGYHWTVT